MPPIKSIVFLCLILIGLSVPVSVSAQNCEDRVEEARQLYENGQFQAAIDKVKDCSENSDNNTRLGVYRLMAMAYIELSDVRSAKAMAVEILKIEPEYEPSVLYDTPEFIKLLEKINVRPQLSLGANLSLATNFSIPDVTRVFDQVDQDDRTYIGLPGLLSGFEINYSFTENLSVFTYLMVSNQRFATEYSVGTIDLRSEERVTYFLLPFGVRYYLENKTRFTPFGDVGFYYGRLIGSQSSFYYHDNSTDEKYSLEKVESTERRSKWVKGLPIGLGVSTPIGNKILSLRVSYMRSLQNLTNEERRYDFPDLALQYLYLDDDIYLNSWALQLGFNIPLKYKVSDSE